MKKPQVATRIAAVCAACALAGYGVSQEAGVTLGVIVLIAAIAFCWIPRAETLPLWALGVTLLVPTESLPLPTLLVGFPIGLVPFGVWVARSRAITGRWETGRILGAAFAAWLIASELFTPVRTNKGLMWFATALVTTSAVAFWPRVGIDTVRLRRFFLNLTVLLGVYAIVEAVLLKSNPVYGSLYARAAVPLVQHWAVYRSTTLMGHPLVNATVFAAALVLAASQLLGGRERVVVAVGRVLVLSGALAATQSRSSLIAAGVGVLFLLFLQRGARGIGIRRAAMIAVGAIALVGLASSLAARNDSKEGRESTAVREGLLSQTEQSLAGTGLFGAGPNEVEAWRIHREHPAPKLALESSYADVAVSLGIGGLALFVMTMLSVLVLAIKNRDAAPEAAVLLSLLISVGAYNALENAAPLILIGIFMSSVISRALSVSGARVGSPRVFKPRRVGVATPVLGAGERGLEGLQL